MKKFFRRLLTKMALNNMFGLYIEEFTFDADGNECEDCVVTDSYIWCKAEF